MLTIPEASPWLALIWVFVLCVSLGLITMTVFFVVYITKAMIRIKPKIDDDGNQFEDEDDA